MKNWKTTLIGLAMAGLEAAKAVQSNKWQDYASAILIAVLGFVAKDFNISGTAS
jgi:hypothetical protein